MDFTRSVLVIVAASQLMFAQGKATIAGIWRGQSSCEQKKSACREETVVYRVSPLQDKPGSFSVSADKIVDGKAVNMGQNSAVCPPPSLALTAAPCARRMRTTS